MPCPRLTCTRKALAGGVPAPHVSFTVSVGTPSSPRRPPHAASEDPLNHVSRNTPGPSPAPDSNVANRPLKLAVTMLTLPATGPAPGTQAAKQIWKAVASLAHLPAKQRVDACGAKGTHSPRAIAGTSASDAQPVPAAEAATAVVATGAAATAVVGLAPSAAAQRSGSEA